jgi:hypothetical protein
VQYTTTGGTAYLHPEGVPPAAAVAVLAEELPTVMTLLLGMASTAALGLSAEVAALLLARSLERDRKRMNELEADWRTWHCGRR